jgi:hypothetical protein
LHESRHIHSDKKKFIGIPTAAKVHTIADVSDITGVSDIAGVSDITSFSDIDGVPAVSVSPLLQASLLLPIFLLVAWDPAVTVVLHIASVLVLAALLPMLAPLLLRRSSVGCGVAQRVRRSSIGCGVAQSGCGVAQLVVSRLAVRLARVRFSARHPMEASVAERRSDEDTRRLALANDQG